MKFKVFYISFFVLFATGIQAQNTKKSYIDIIDYWKKEKFNNKVKEINTEHAEYVSSFGGDKNEKKLRSYTKSKQIFNKFGCLVSQIDQITSYSIIGSNSQKTNTRINYEYDTKYKLLKEKIYTNIDTITLKPTDTANYSLKVYNYNINEPLKECLEYNNSKVLIKRTSFITDTLKYTLEIDQNDVTFSNGSRKIYQFDKNSILIEQTIYKGNQIKGKNYYSYDENGRKSKIAFSSATSMFESLETFVYDKNGFLVEHGNGSNLDPGNKKYYHYTFDINKNWITKEIKNEDGILIQSFKRNITYFK